MTTKASTLEISNYTKIIEHLLPIFYFYVTVSFNITTHTTQSKAIVVSLIIEHAVNFALSGNSHGPCNSIQQVVVISCQLTN